MHCIGWIPNFTGNIGTTFSDKKLTNLNLYKKRSEQIKISDVCLYRKKKEIKKENTLNINIEFTTKDYNKYLKKYNKHLINIKNISDLKNEKKCCLFFYWFATNSEKYPNLISLYQNISKIEKTDDTVYYKFEHIIDIKIEKFEDKGLVVLKSSNFNKSLLDSDISEKKIIELLLVQSFNDLRDLYHDHYHHHLGDLSEVADDMNKPYIINSKENTPLSDQNIKTAIDYILNTYQKRYSSYLKMNNKIISSFTKMRNAFETSILVRRQTKGCGIYALNFLEFYKEYINYSYYNNYQNTFYSGNQVIDTFSEQINTEILLAIENKWDLFTKNNDNKVPNKK
jgi:hypothetical protein